MDENKNSSEHFVFDCGEDDLDPCQKRFYFTKENDIVELVETIKSCQAAIAGRRQEETRSNTSIESGVAQRNVLAASSAKPSQPIVVQTSTGVGNGQGYMILDPNTLRIVSSGNNVKVFTVTPPTAVASNSQSVVTPSSVSSLRVPLSASQVRHNLPQQMTPRFRPQIRALSPSAVNTKVVQTSTSRLVTAQNSVVPGVGIQVNVSTSLGQSPPSIPFQIRVISPPKPSSPRYKIVSGPFKPGTSPTVPVVSQPSSTGYVPFLPPLVASSHVRAASQTASGTPYVPLVSQASSISPYVPVVSQAQTISAYAAVVSQAQNISSYAPVASLATSVSPYVPVVSQAKTPVQLASVVSQTGTLRISQPPTKVNIAHQNVANLNSTSNSIQSSLPLLPVTRMSPPLPVNHSKSIPPGFTPSSNQLSPKISKPSTERSSEVLEGVKSKNATNGTRSPSPSDLVDLTAEDNHSKVSSKTGSDNASVSTSQGKSARKNFVKEKTFPSLVVSARACLKVIPNSVASSERLSLDNQLRKVLQMPPQMFTEHLLQQRLLRSEQRCKNHSQNLKLGMYSDAARYPHSGGYVWISECCNAGFCSVFSGSIFDKSVQPPTTILKLMYHWSSNTAVHNVLQWVKVDNFVVKTYYTFFRAVCTATVQEKMGLLGGAAKQVQVGVISLGTSEGQGKKDVKVDILAALDTDTMQLQLRALDNSDICNDSDFYEKKLRRILETLQEWIHPNSVIITDFPVDLSLCRQYGFGYVVVSGGKSSATNNLEVVGYLKNWVPKMFQNTLNLLSLQIIQQFLDELVWRERWGPIPSRAYESLINHISDMTKLPGPDIITKLKKIASFPTKNWKFYVWKNTIDWSSADLSSSESTSATPQASVPLSNSTPLPRVPSPISEEPSKPQDSTSKLKTTLLSYKEILPKSQKPKNNELAIKKKTGPVIPTKTYGAVPSVFDSIPSRKSTEDTFDIDDIIPLESYYYGYIKGIPNRQKYTGAFLAECALCKRDFLSSSSFTKHLIHHALNDNEAWDRAVTDQLMSVCHVCLLPVNDVAAHLVKKHPKPVSTIQTACKICNVDHKTDERLFKHMTNVHCELDMPYSCEECQYRTSIYEDAAAHFKNFHDKDSCVQCPFCLKVVRFCTTAGIEIPSNQYYFIQHIQKHNVSKLNRKCEKCMLSFTNMGILKSHQENFHCSGKNLYSAIRYNNNPAKFVKMKRPVAKPLPPVTLHESSFHTLKGKALATIFKVDPALSNFNCAECDSPIVPNHFSVKMTCTRCTFQSHCANAIKEHSARTHLTLDVLVSKLPQIMGGNPLLRKTLFCSQCTFSTINGNRMATHLAECKSTAVATTEKRKLQHLNVNEDFPSKYRKYY
uniref:Pogo transposable element with ZNF domain n=4 Tax=Lygus hesperus TaxID=30085 RepID=A0A146KVV3_LYGHE